MQTNSVANPLNPLNTLTPLPAAKESQKSDGPAFDQVLSREITNRKDAEPTQTPSDTQASSPVKGEQGKQGKQEQTTATNSANKTDTADKAERAEGAAENAAGTEVAQETVLSISAEMLALVNSLNLTPLQTDKPVTPGSTDLLASKGKRAETLLTVADKLNVADKLSSMASAEQQTTSDNAPGKSRAPDLKVEAATPAVIDIAKDVGRNVKLEAAFTAELHSALDTTPTGLQSLQQNTNVTTQTATAPVTEHIAPRVGTSAWDQAIGQRVVWMVNGDQQTAELTLNPPDLGPLKVVLNVSNAQADATFTAAQPEVRQALEAAMPKLRDMLSEAGIQLGQASVNSGQPNQQSDGDRQAARGTDNDNTQNDGRSEAANVTRVPPTSIGRGLVDTFV